jgi:putative transposase
VTALLRREGHEVNAKRVQRVRRKEGLQVSRRRRKLRRLGLSTAERQRATRANHVWSWDFVEDQTENGTRFRMLTLIDEHTRECLAVHVDWSIRAVDVITIVEAAMVRYGVPTHLRSDNGPEFIAYASQDGLQAKSVKTIYITPGAPWENAYIESFHDKLRDECLNREIFGSLWEARVVIEQWRLYYNAERPHSSLGYQTPDGVCRPRHRQFGTPVGLRPPSVPNCRTKHQTNGQNSTFDLSTLWVRSSASGSSFLKHWLL